MKIFLLLTVLSFTLCNNSTAQILCILCYDQNDSISIGVNNLLLNGGFETTDCDPSTGVIGEHTSICPNSNGYACDFANWTCTGGGSNTYACLYNDSINKSIIIQGTNAVYMGNFYCSACSPNMEDISCITYLDCTVTGIPNGYPLNPDISFGGATGVSLEQTANGLIPGNNYVLEFWAGGEQYMTENGLFALDVGFGDTMLSCKSTGPGDSGTVYIIQFKATSPSHTIKFTNWGHVCSDCTELVLDNVRLYKLAELDASVPPCIVETVSFAASSTSLCQKFCLNFLDESTNNPTDWLWQFPGGDPSFSTDQNPNNICYDVPGIYDVTLITTNANGNDTLTLTDYITVYPTPGIPTVTQNGYTLTSSPADFYQWQLDAIDIPGATDQTYDVQQSGLYTVIVSDSNGCKNSTTLYVLLSGVEEISNLNFTIHPNPSSGNFIIQWMNAQSIGDISVVVENSMGQKVFSSEEKISPGDWKKQIDLTGSAAGFYFVEIKSSNKVMRKKIVLK